MRTVLTAASILALAATACSAQPAVRAAAQPGGRGAPVDYGRANAAGQAPAFPQQTRAPAVAVASPTLSTTVIARGLDHPWALEQLPDGRFIVTERSGHLRIVGRDGRLGEPISGLPRLFVEDQGGLLDVALPPDFATSRRVWFSYSEPQANETNNTAVASGVLSADERSLTDVRVVWRQRPPWRSTKHFGGRIVFDGQGHVFITTGERSNEDSRPHAQDLDYALGKVIRLNLDGSVPRDNPFVGRAGALPEIWSLGHRNLQAAALDSQGRLWTVEHGPRGGDELNRPRPGLNYGWPIITYGEDYSGEPIGAGITSRAGLEQPVYYWDPVIAPSGMVFYSGGLVPQWRGDVFIGGLGAHALVRLVLENDRVVGEERLPMGQRVRDVIQGSDGALYIVTDEDAGQLIRIAPR